MYNILYYNDLQIGNLKRKLDKLTGYLAAGDFQLAEVKKLKPSGYYRAKLDDTNRVLFTSASHGGEHYLLILEIIHQHDYASSRFLRGVSEVDESRIDAPAVSTEALPLPVKPSQQSVHCLDKFIVFDDNQSDILSYTLPLVVIGSAGSGKTSVTLEKLKTLTGDILYVSLSDYLVQHTERVYFSHHYENKQQQLEFLSFQDFLGSILVPKGEEITASSFRLWCQNQPRPVALKDTQKLFEEFRGVLTGSDPQSECLSREDYLALGVKQSIYLASDRGAVYDCFSNYRKWLANSDYYDSNMLAFRYQQHVTPRFDAVVVDEVQDFTNSQLALVLKSLRSPEQFLLCGDANQIVHPNFFSWSKLKSFFYQDKKLQTHDITRILKKNYRNTPEVTELANRVLRFKNARFGSIDKESHYLVESTANSHGHVACLAAAPKLLKEMNDKTRQSTHYAVLVLNHQDKAKAERVFDTPLIFTVQEAKGLEYHNVILYDFVSSEAKYHDIAKGVDPNFLEADFNYGRAADKTDKSLEVFKFYVNALYVAITRAVKNVYLMEADPKHRFLRLLDINEIKTVDIQVETSSQAEWQKEASKLAKQGKAEQAKAIEDKILKHKTVPWTVLTTEESLSYENRLLSTNKIDKKDGILLLNYALLYGQPQRINRLNKAGLKAAKHAEKARGLMVDNHFSDYAYRNSSSMQQKVNQYGLEFRNPFNFTPLMSAAYMGSKPHIDALLELGADPELRDNLGRSPLMITLEQATYHKKWQSKKIFDTVYELLRPETLTLQADNKLIKLHARQSEFLIFFLAVNTALQVLREVDNPEPGSVVTFRAGHIEQDLLKFGEQTVPAYRKRRQYINGLLARNEVRSQYPYNKKLFIRQRVGVYVLNPDLQWRIKTNWHYLLESLFKTNAKTEKDVHENST